MPQNDARRSALFRLPALVPRSEIYTCARTQLEHGNSAAQELAMMILRYFGHDVWGHDYGEKFYWTLDGERIDPKVKDRNV